MYPEPRTQQYDTDPENQPHQWKDQATSPGAIFEHRAETIARGFHEAYEQLAPDHSYKTREASAVPWEDVPDNNKKLMIRVVKELMLHGIIH